MRLSVASIPIGIINVTQPDRPPTANSGKLITALCVGVTSLTVAIVISVINVVQILATIQSSVTQGSHMMELFHEDLEMVHMSTFIYNVTNAERFVGGLDNQLKLEEVGPFTYKEIRSHLDIELDSQEAILRYTPKMHMVFVPEESVANPKDINIVVPNLALLAFASKLSTYSMWLHMGLNMLAARFNTESILKMSAQDFLWGFDEPLVKFGNSLLPGWIDFDSMGILDRICNKSQLSRFEVSTKDSHKFQIETFDGSRGLRNRGYDDPDKRSTCNTFVNTYEGFGYPTAITPTTPLRVFRSNLCRIMDIEFKEKRILDGYIEAYVYKMSHDTFKTNSENRCLCGYGKICNEGMSDLSACLYDLPFTLSSPFIIDDRPEFKRISYLPSKSAKSSNEVLIEPTVGMPLSSDVALQVNLNIGDVSYNSASKPFSKMILPIAYFKLIQPKLLDEQIQILHKMYYLAPRILLALLIILYSVSFIALSYAFWTLYWNWICSDGRGIAFHVPLEGKNNPLMSADIPLMEYEKSDNFSSRLTLSTGIDDMDR